MHFDQIETPIGLVDLSFHFVPKELKERRHNEEPKDEFYAYIQTKSNTAKYGEENNEQHLIINGIPVTFNYRIEWRESEQKFVHTSLSTSRRDKGFRTEATPGAREKIYKLPEWLTLWFRTHKHVMHIERENALRAGVERLKHEANEKREEASKLDQKAAELEKLYA